ncbi:MAG: T9SS type A sorting domain-containing protein [Bacteroidales bacterium]|nr:T9SS type A sorting domain-containing protein [Bacteroidales bacterium]
MMIQKLIVLLAVLLLVPGDGLDAQENNWEWVDQIDGAMTYPSFVTSGDKYNNYYALYGYGDTIAFPDTLFHHPWSLYNWYYALAKYNDKGRFQFALDFAALNNSGLAILKGCKAYRDQSVYSAGLWSKQMLLSDTILSTSEQTNGFVARFNGSGKRVWTKFITGTSNANVNEIEITPEGKIVIAGTHYAAWEPETVYFFGTDSMTHLYGLHFVLQIDSLGHIDWITPIRSLTIGTPHLRDIRCTQDGRYVLEGETSTSLIIGQDTLWDPDPQSQSVNFLIILNEEGSPVYSRAFVMPWNIHDFIPGDSGHFYFAGSYYDSLVFSNLTIPAPEENHYPAIMGKMDSSLHLLWYHTYETEPYYGYKGVNLTISRDTLFPSFTFQHSTTINDCTYSAGYYLKTLIMEYSMDGELLDLFMHKGSKLVITNYVYLDNCSNLAISGCFSGTAEFGNLSLTTPGDTSGFLGKYIRIAHPFDLGQDTTAIDEFLIIPPGNWAVYDWNFGESTEPEFMVTKTGWYYLSVADLNWCWRSDSIHVTIKPNPGIQENSNRQVFSIYPNPTTGSFILECSDPMAPDPVEVTIHSIHGQLVLKDRYPYSLHHEIWIDTEPTGLYFIRIVAGDLVETHKIIKQ